MSLKYIDTFVLKTLILQLSMCSWTQRVFKLKIPNNYIAKHHYPKSHEMDRVFTFHHIDISWRNRERQRLFWEFTIWSSQKFYSFEKNQRIFSWKNGWLCSKAYQRGLPFCLSWPVIKKNWSFLILYEKYRIFSCTAW